MFENFSYPKIFASTPWCPKHRGVILKYLKLSQKGKNNKNGPRASLMGPGAVLWTNGIQKISWDCPFKYITYGFNR